MRILLLSFLLCSLQINAQTFFKTFGGPASDNGWFIIEDSTGNFILAGDSGRNQSAKMLLLKTNSAGNVLWSKTYGDSVETIARCVKATLNGGFILHGDKSSSGSGTESFLLKTSATGDSLWSKFALGSFPRRNGISIEVLPDYTIVIGTTEDDIQSYNPYQLIKLDTAGNGIWNHYADALFNTYIGYGSSLTRTFDNGFVVTGAENFTWTTGYDNIGITKIDSVGNVVWAKTYSTTLSCAGASVIQCADSGFLIAGSTSDTGNTVADFLIMKTDKNGDSLWSKHYGGSGSDYFTCIQQMSNGNYILFGNSNSVNGNYNAVVLKVDQNGDSIWQKSFGGTGTEIVRHGIICRDGGIALIGSTSSFGAGQEDVFILKIDSMGNMNTDISDINKSNILIYPNPVSKILKINILDNTDGKISFFNTSGSLIYQSEILSKEISINTTHWSNGFYFCRIEQKGFQNNFKIIKVD